MNSSKAQQSFLRNMYFLLGTTALVTVAGSVSAYADDLTVSADNQVLSDDAGYSYDSISVGNDSTDSTDARLTVSGGSTVTVDSDVSVGGNGAVGKAYLTVTGSNSSVTATSGTLYVGSTDADITDDDNFVTAVVRVEDGGSVSADKLVVGNGYGTGGSVYVTGSGSSLSADSATIGSSLAGSTSGGTGSLTISDGGAVSIDGGDGTLTIADGEGSTGTVTIDGGTLKAATVAFGSGTGELDFTGDSNTLSAAITGDGDINVGTSSDTSSATLSGSLDDFTGTLSVANADSTLTLSGESDTSATVSGAGTLDIAADVTLSGDDALKDFSGTVDISTAFDTLTLTGDNKTSAKFSGTNAYLAIDSGAAVTLTADGALNDLVSSDDSHAKVYIDDSSTLTLTGDNKTSAVLSSTDSDTTGTLYIGTADDSASLELTSGSSLDGYYGTVSIADGSSLQVDGDTSTSATLTGSGALTIGDGDSTTSNTVTLSSSLSDYSGAITIASDGTLALTASNTDLSNELDGSGTLQIGDGTNTTSLTYTGDLSTFDGALDIESDSTLELTASNDDLSNELDGSGTFQIGDGTNKTSITYTGDSSASFTGTTSVTANALLEIAEGASLGGSTSVSGEISGSGTVSSLELHSGATYGVTVDGSDTSNAGLDVTGTLTIDSSGNDAADVAITLTNGEDLQVGTAYTVITYGSLSSSVDTLDASLTNADDYAYIDVSDVTLGDTSGTVTFTVDDSTSFADAVTGSDETAALSAAQSAGSDSEIYNQVAFLKSSEVQKAAEELSGSSYASSTQAVMASTSSTRNIINSRIESAFGGVATTETAIVSSHGDDAQKQVASTGGPVVWGKTYGSWSKLAGSDGTGGSQSLSGGAIVGADAEVYDGWRAGVFAGYGYTHTRASGVTATSDADTYQIGAYGGHQFGPIGLRGGVSYAWNNIDADRSIDVSTIQEDLSSNYWSTTLQAFGELGYTFRHKQTSVEPFVNEALVYQDTESFNEDGGSAALHVASTDQTQGITTVGVRFEQDVSSLFTNTGPIFLTGSAAWQHTAGDIDAANTMRYLAGGNAFRVTGDALDRDQAALSAGVRAEIAKNTTLSVSYDGTLSGKSQSHGGEATLAIKF